MIEKIIWDDKKYSVGHALMDSHHKNVIAMINNMIDLSETAYTRIDALQALTEMSRYAEKHFGAEERLLLPVNTLLFDEQVRSHENYSSRISHFMMYCTGESFGDVLNFLVDWWANHILIEDMQYKHLFSEGK